MVTTTKFTTAGRVERWMRPIVVLGVLWRALCNVGSHQKILQVLKVPVFAELANEYPRFAFKYLARDYLARGLTVQARASCFVHHYLWLHEKLPEELVTRILRQGNGIRLVELEDGVNHFDIDLSFWGTVDKEGELSLHLKVDDEKIFTVSFTVVPGSVVKSEARDVLLVTQLQGEKGKVRQISLVYRIMHGAGPAPLLLTVLEAIGETLSIRALACISAIDQPFYRDEFIASFQSSYDSFFRTRGMTKNDADVFLSSIPTTEKPLELVKRKDKRRTLKRRELKRLIGEGVRRVINGACNGDDVLPLRVRLEPSPQDPLEPV
jgi:uncharacterized protein VirK/YbjX